MATADDYLDLKRRTDAARREQDRQAGAVDRLLKELKDRYGCATTTEATKEITRREKLVAQLEQKLAAGVTEYDRRWSHPPATP